jgi:glycosyltransferase involved in cell wall biosynthesis
MEKQPLISVIVPVYNVEKYLPECIESIKDQTYKNIEVLLIDDGSTDSSGQICDEAAKKDNRIKVIHKENQGISHTRNTGLSKCTGDYLTFIDSDDYVTNDYVEYLFNQIEKTGADLSIAAHLINCSSGNTEYKGIGEDYEFLLNSKQVLEYILLDQKIDISVWGKIYRKKLFDGLQFPNGEKFEEPAIMYKVIENADKIVCGGQAKYIYNIRPQSITTTVTFSGKMQLIDHTKKMCSDITAKYPDLSQAADRRLVWAYFSTLNQLLKASDRKDFKVEEKEILNFLKSKRKEIRRLSVYSKRDKLASLALSFGLPVYNFVWKLYQKISK